VAVCGNMADARGELKLLTKAQVPFYFKTNDKVAWIARENVNIVAIAHTLHGLENDFSQGATKRIDIRLKLLDLQTGETEREFGYNLVFSCPVLEIVCDLTPTSGYPLLNVFARLEDFRSCAFVFSCPAPDSADRGVAGEALRKEIEVKLDRCNRKSNRNFHWGASVSFIRVSPLRNGRYWFGVILNDGEFILLEMAVKRMRPTSADFHVHCMREIKSSEIDLTNLPFSWRLLDFSPDLKSLAIIGRGSYVFYIGLVFLDLDSFTVSIETNLKGFNFVADAKYSHGGNFFLALCSGQRIKMPLSDSRQSGIDFEDCRSVLIWDTLGNLLQKVNFTGDSTLSAYELYISPYDNYIVIPQSGVDSNKKQFSLFLMHNLDFSKPETQFDAKEILRMDHDKGTDNYTSCNVSLSGHQLLVIHCCNMKNEDRSEDVSNLLTYKMNNSPTELTVLCRMAVNKQCDIHKLSLQEVPKEILSYLNWC